LLQLLHFLGLGYGQREAVIVRDRARRYVRDHVERTDARSVSLGAAGDGYNLGNTVLLSWGHGDSQVVSSEGDLYAPLVTATR
jgi:hypothetical protein